MRSRRLRSLREITFSKLSPAGTAESSPGRSPGLRLRDEPVPQGRLRVAQDVVLGSDLRDEPVPQGRLRVAQDVVLGTDLRDEPVPQGRLRVAQDVVLGTDLRDEPVPQGRLIITQDAILGTLPLKLTLRGSAQKAQDHVLGNFSAVPTGLLVAPANPGLTSWATLSRPCGTQFGECSLKQYPQP